MKNKGFTLIEIMIVLVIIGILMGLISAAVFKAMENAKISKAKADIAVLETALSAYEADTGDYPPQQSIGQGWEDNNFRTRLQDGDATSGWNGPYMHFKNDDLSVDGTDFLDPWGRRYEYEYCIGCDYFWIRSLGPDGVRWNSDDITSG